MMRKILLTNDDGYDAPGLKALTREFSKHNSCFVVAPLSERSASGHSVTLKNTIKVRELKTRGKLVGFAVDGTPADCVKFALKEHYQDSPPDLVVSGLNPGPNLGVSVYYSGTVGAAREAIFSHIPAFAISINGFVKSGFKNYAKWAANTVRKIYAIADHHQCFYNINIPVGPKKPRGLRITHQSHSRFVEEFIPVGKARGKLRTYRLAGHMEVMTETGFSDDEAVRGGYISVTPCQLDVSHYPEIKRLGRKLGKQKREKK